MGENVQQKKDDLLIHSEYANVSVTLFFHISKMPELGGGPGYIYRTISMVDRAELQRCGCRNWESTTHLLCF